jgi:hypothetical protein
MKEGSIETIEYCIELEYLDSLWKFESPHTEVTWFTYVSPPQELVAYHVIQMRYQLSITHTHAHSQTWLKFW